MEQLSSAHSSRAGKDVRYSMQDRESCIRGILSTNVHLCHVAENPKTCYHVLPKCPPSACRGEVSSDAPLTCQPGQHFIRS